MVDYEVKAECRFADLIERIDYCKFNVDKLN